MNQLITEVFVEQPLASPGSANFHKKEHWIYHKKEQGYFYEKVQEHYHNTEQEQVIVLRRMPHNKSTRWVGGLSQDWLTVN